MTGRQLFALQPALLLHLPSLSLVVRTNQRNIDIDPCNKNPHPNLLRSMRHFLPLWLRLSQPLQSLYRLLMVKNLMVTMLSQLAKK